VRANTAIAVGSASLVTLLVLAGCTLPVVRRTEIQPGWDEESGVSIAYFQPVFGDAVPGDPERVPPANSYSCLGILAYARLGYNVGRHFGLDLTGYGALGGRVPGLDATGVTGYASIGARARPLDANWLVTVDVPYPCFSIGTTVGLPLRGPEVWNLQIQTEFLGLILPAGIQANPLTASVGVARNFNLESVTLSPNISVTMGLQQLHAPYRVLAGITFRRPRQAEGH